MSQKKRIKTITMCFLVGVAVLVVRLFWIQFVKGGDYKYLASQQQTRDSVITAKRGTIYDRNMKVLAQSASAERVTINPQTIEKNKNALLVLTGKEEIDFDLYDINYVMPKAKIPNIETIPTIAILNRPDVMGSIDSLNSAIYSTFSSKSALYPTIAISGNIGQIIASSNGVGDLLWSITASLTAPLLNRKELYESWRIKQEAEKQAELTLRKVISTAISEIEDSIFQLNANRKVYENSISSFKNSTDVMNFIENKYKYGLLDVIELLKSKNEFYNSKISLNTAEFNEILSNINLYKAFGGGFGKPLDMVKYGTDY